MLIHRQAVAPLVSAALLLGCNALTSSAPITVTRDVK